MPEEMTPEFNELLLGHQKKLAELVEDEHAWLTLAAKHKCTQAEYEKNSSIQIHNMLLKQTTTVCRPSVVMRPDIIHDGVWIAQYGHVEGRGLTPELACQDFDSVWLKE